MYFVVIVFTPKHNHLQALWIHGKVNFWAFFCILPSKLSEKAKKTGEMENHYPDAVLKFLQIFRDPGWQNHFQEKQLQQEVWWKNPTVCLKIKLKTRSYMNTYLLQVALWKAKSDKYKHYTELQASLPKPQTRCVLQRKQQNNIYNGRQSQINQPNFKTDLWSRNSKYDEQFQPYMF